jgi:hypothetical protein
VKVSSAYAPPEMVQLNTAYKFGKMMDIPDNPENQNLPFISDKKAFVRALHHEDETGKIFVCVYVYTDVYIYMYIMHVCINQGVCTHIHMNVNV